MKRKISFILNGDRVEAEVEPWWTLLYFLREVLGLTGTKESCGMGECGTCTVIIDGDPALSCMTLAIRCQNRSIMTIEGLAQGGQLHPLQKSAIDYDAVQCGFCTPGWLLSAKVLLDKNPCPTLDEVRAAIAGNLCRCTGYRKIEESILAVTDGKAE